MLTANFELSSTNFQAQDWPWFISDIWRSTSAINCLTLVDWVISSGTWSSLWVTSYRCNQWIIICLWDYTECCSSIELNFFSFNAKFDRIINSKNHLCWFEWYSPLGFIIRDVYPLDVIIDLFISHVCVVTVYEISQKRATVTAKPHSAVIAQGRSIIGQVETEHVFLQVP